MNDPMIASIFEQDLIQLLNRELIAGNDGLQILSFFLSVFAVWVLARFFKKLLSTMSKKSDAQSTRSVFLLSVGKALPLLGIWGGIRLGVCWIELGDDIKAHKRGKLAGIVGPSWKYVFVDNKGKLIAERDRARLALELMDGKVTVLDNSHLFDKAIKQAITRIKGLPVAS